MSVLTTQPAPPTQPLFDEEPPAEGGSKRTLFILLGMLGAIVAAGAVWFFLFSGSGGSTTTPQPAAVPTAAAPKASSAPTAPTGGSTGTKKSSYTLTSRDPFAPLTTSGKAASTSTSTATSSGSSGAPAPAAPVVTPPITIILASVDQKAGTAALSVDGASYTATVGKVFGKNYMLYAVFNATCAGVLVGDQSVPVCVGHSVSVTP